MPEFSVVINTRDHPESLARCLEALAAQSLAPKRWEIVVVDDGSRDDATAEAARAWAGKSQCRLVRLEPSGRAAARNAGVREARGERVLFLGDDILAEPDLLQRHLRCHETHKGSVAVVGFVADATETPSRAFRKWWDNLLYDHIPNPERAGFGRLYTCNASAPRQAILDAGGFDERFIRYGWEDIDLGYRLERHGVRIVYDPRARAEHRHPRPTLDDLLRREYELGFSAAWHFGKWADEPEVQRQRFWKGDAATAGSVSPGRRAAARRLILLCERFLPLPFLLAPLYGRLVWSHRFQGLRDGAKHYAPMLEKRRRGADDDGNAEA